MNAVSIGVFDGLHLGHRQILARAIAAARARGGRAIVVSFDPHPDVVLAKTFRPLPPLTPIPEKRARLHALGIDAFDVLPFTRELAALDPETFLERHVISPHHPGTLVVGENFALGRGRAGHVGRLREIGDTLGFTVDAVPLMDIDGAPVTSTRIRDALATGAVADAARLLGRRYTLSGTVVTGEAIGRTLGFPTANLRLHEEKFLPADGVYAARARIHGASGWIPAAMSIGVRPTFGGTARAIEAFLLDWSGELVGRELELECVAWIRAQVAFDGPEALMRAIDADVVEARRLLARADADAPSPT